MHLLRAIAITFLSVPATVSAAALYVAPTGNDANPGSLSAPFRTISRGAAMAKPGDVVYVRGGVYNEIVKASVKGTASARITIQSYPGETAVIDGTNTAPSTDLVQLGSAEYLDFTGFEVRNSTRLGIASWGAKHVRILNNKVHHSYRGGIYAGHSAFGNTYDITIADNMVYNNVVMNATHSLGGGAWGQSISVQYADRLSIARNRVYENDGEGIAVILTDNAVIEGNEVSDSFSVGIYLDNAQATTVNGNFVYSTGNTRYFRDGYPASGIAMANESYSSTNPLGDVTVTNNIVVDARYALYYGAFENGGGLKNTTITNNTFYKARTAMLWLEADAHANNLVQNNVFFQSGGGTMFTGSTAGTVFRSNNWYGGNAGAAAGDRDVLGDPRLGNAGGLRADDYKLGNLSPLIHTARDASTVTKDFWGNARTSAYDIGAHEQSISLGSSSPAAIEIAVEAPVRLVAVADSPVTIQLSWAPVEGASGYRVYRDRSLLTTLNGTVWVDANLASQTTYSYAVTALGRDGYESAPTENVTATTPASRVLQAPALPEAVVAEAKSATQIALAWKAAGNVTGYVIYRDGVHVATVSATSWTDTGLAPAMRYVYEVQAYDAAGNYSGRVQATATTHGSSNRKRGAGRG